MNTLIVKYQLIMLAFIIAITSIVIVGINKGRVLHTKIDLNPSIKMVTNPVNWKLQNQKTISLLNNQTFFQSVVSPKQFTTNQNEENNNAESIPVLLYHGVTEKPDGENVTIDQFRAHLISLKKAGYQTITLKQFEKWNNGELNLPKKSFLLTFDDGRKDSFYNVDPILEALDFNAVTYIISKHSTGEVHTNYYVTEKELKAIQKTNRWEIESHSKNAHETVVIAQDGKQANFYGNKVWNFTQNRLETDEEFRQRIATDLSISKKELETALGHEVTSLALPFGDYGQNSQNFDNAPTILKEEASKVYKTIMYQTWADNFFNEPLFNYADPNKNMIKRIDVKTNWTSDKLLTVLSAHQDKSLTFGDSFSKDQGWVKNWGEMQLENNSLSISSNEKAHGSLVFLSGGLNWTDYTAKAYIDWLSGEDATIIARFQNSDNFVSCRIGDGQVSIAERVDGVDTVLKIAKKELPLQLFGTSIEISVQGTNVSCKVEGEEIATTDNLSPLLNYGSIGFASWDKNPNNSAILIKNVYVEEIN